MIVRLRTVFLSSAAVLAAAGAAVPAMAQSAAAGTADASGVSDEIIVTARRQNEKLQDVPASITVFTSKVLEQSGVKVAADFVKLTPGVSIVTGTAEAGDTQINIRGLNGARDAENNVALVVDGILKTNTSALNQNQGALQQIEVLKGPQGAIYGRNAAAGAIVITTRLPGDHLVVEGKASYGSNSTFTGSGFLSGPLSDQVGFVLSGDYSKSDGFFRNSFLPSAINQAAYPGNSTKAASIDDYERFDINGRLYFDLGGTTKIDLKARYGKYKGGSISFNSAFQIPGLFSISDKVDSNIDVNKHPFKFDMNIDPENNQRTIEGSGRFETALGLGTLSGYVSYSNIKNDFFADGTSGAFGFFNNEPTCAASITATAGVIVQEPFQTVGGFRGSQPYSPRTCDGTQYQRRNQEDVTAELRLASGAAGAFTWQFGTSFIHINRRVCINLGLDTAQDVVRQCYTTSAINPTEALADDTFRTNVYAAFGAADYKFSDQLKLSLALRYDIEDRKVDNNVPTGRRTRWVGNVLTGNPNGTATTPANYYLNPGLDPAYNPSGVLGPRSAVYRQLEPKLSMTYEPSRDLTLYANWGIGFKAGGFNAGGSKAIINGYFNNGGSFFGGPINAGLSINDDYRKEKDSAFEVGLKGKILDGRVSYEAAGYYTDVTDQQFFEFFVGPFGLLRLVSNIDKVRLYGAEGSLDVRVLEGWHVFGSANVTNSKIKKNSARPYTVGNKAPYTPDYTLNFGSQVDVPFNDDINVALRADYRVTGPTFFHTVQNNNVPNIFFGDGAFGKGNFVNSQRDAFGVLNLRATVSGKNWSLAGFANNALAKHYLAEVIPAPEFGGDFVSPGAGAYYGVEVGFKF